jgi:sporulation protein YqfC
MDNYISEIINICKLPFEEVSKDYKVVILGGKSIYVTNYKKIIDYSSNKVVLKIKNNTLEIAGDSLEINQINKGEILISGKIYSCGLGVVGEKK